MSRDYSQNYYYCNTPVIGSNLPALKEESVANTLQTTCHLQWIRVCSYS